MRTKQYLFHVLGVTHDMRFMPSKGISLTHPSKFAPYLSKAVVFLRKYFFFLCLVGISYLIVALPEPSM